MSLQYYVDRKALRTDMLDTRRRKDIDSAFIRPGYDALQIRLLVREILEKDDSEITTRWFDAFTPRRRAQSFEKERLLQSTVDCVL